MPDWNFLKHLAKEFDKDDATDTKEGEPMKGNDSRAIGDSDNLSSGTRDNEQAQQTLLSNATKYEKNIGFASDIGMSRSTDEDSIVIMDLKTAFEAKRRRKVILILADGMGGHNKGEVASKIASSTVAYELQRFIGDGDIGEEMYHDVLSSAISVANRQILRYAEMHPEAEGMGTTLSVAIMDENHMLYLANVGDSRVYVINCEEGAIQRTRDHTYVQQLVDTGKITKEESRHHPKKNILDRAVGLFEDLEVDTSCMQLSKDDFILVCCDGLTNHISDDELSKIVLDNLSTQQACEKLVALANQRGGKDNISLIIAPASVGEL